MIYPKTLSERDTLDMALAGYSLARFGDGELRIALGAESISQRADPKLRNELRDILGGKSKAMPCIPNLWSATPRTAFWRPYASSRYTQFYREGVTYGSSFITRPDNAPWIDRPEYWAGVHRLWRNRRVAYVSGDNTLLNVVKQDAEQVTVIPAPSRDAYSVIDQLERQLLQRPYGVVLIALGAAGTALAARLAGAQHAIDLGHIGQFMTNPGAFSHSPDDLVSPEYRKLLRDQHARTRWGKGGHSWADKVAAFAGELKVGQVLDYGCGSGTLKPALAALGIKCAEYDPGILGKDIPPKLADLVVSTDVFEHIEPEKVDAVLAHTFALARKGAFFAIAKQPAKAILGDGRNAHLICEPDAWWIAKLKTAGWRNLVVAETAWKKCVILCRK